MRSGVADNDDVITVGALALDVVRRSRPLLPLCRRRAADHGRVLARSAARTLPGLPRGGCQVPVTRLAEPEVT